MAGTGKPPRLTPRRLRHGVSLVLAVVVPHSYPGSGSQAFSQVHPSAWSPVVGLDGDDEVDAARWAARLISLDHTQLRSCYEGDSYRVAAASRRPNTA